MLDDLSTLEFKEYSTFPQIPDFHMSQSYEGVTFGFIDYHKSIISAGTVIGHPKGAKLNKFGQVVVNIQNRIHNYGTVISPKDFPRVTEEERLALGHIDLNATITREEAITLAKWASVIKAAEQAIESRYGHRGLGMKLNDVTEEEIKFSQSVWKTVRSLGSVDDAEVEGLYKSIVEKTAFNKDIVVN